jgi:hypothetical protein
LRRIVPSGSAGTCCLQDSDHTIGFRQSAAYQDWKRLLHRYYDPFPVVSHYQAVAGVS